MAYFMFYWFTQKVSRSFVITICFSSVSSVFSVAIQVLKDGCFAVFAGEAVTIDSVNSGTLPQDLQPYAQTQPTCPPYPN
jgi:hypothetical protein